jgi:hypothetical protein
MDYLLKTTAESIEHTRGSVNRIGKGGSYLLCLRKSADFRLKENSVETVSVYKRKRLESNRMIWVGMLKV